MLQAVLTLLKRGFHFSVFRPEQPLTLRWWIFSVTLPEIDSSIFLNREACIFWKFDIFFGTILIFFSSQLRIKSFAWGSNLPTELANLSLRLIAQIARSYYSSYILEPLLGLLLFDCIVFSHCCRIHCQSQCQYSLFSVGRRDPPACSLALNPSC